MNIQIKLLQLKEFALQDRNTFCRFAFEVCLGPEAAPSSVASVLNIFSAWFKQKEKKRKEKKIEEKKGIRTISIQPGIENSSTVAQVSPPENRRPCSGWRDFCGNYGLKNKSTYYWNYRFYLMVHKNMEIMWNNSWNENLLGSSS